MQGGRCESTRNRNHQTNSTHRDLAPAFLTEPGRLPQPGGGRFYLPLRLCRPPPGLVLLTLGATLLTAVRRPGASPSTSDVGPEIALVVLSTIWLSPVVWSLPTSTAVLAGRWL